MIIQYDTRPDATLDEKLRSLIESIQLAFGEVGIRENNNVTSHTINIDAVLALVRELAEDVRSYDDAISQLGDRLTTAEGSLDTLLDTTIPALDTRVTALEGRWTAPAAPNTDGAYKLTVTVTDGVPVYTWESA